MPERDRARLCQGAEGAGVQERRHLRAALDRVGRRLRRLQQHQRRSGRGRQSQISPPAPAASPAGARLSCHARHRGRASRSPAAAPTGAWRRGSAAARSDAFQAGVYGATRSGPAYLAARARLRQSLDVAPTASPPCRRSPHRRFQRAEFWRPRRERLSLRRRRSSASRPTPRCRRRASTRRATARSTVDGGGFGLSFNSRTAHRYPQRARRRASTTSLAFDRDAVLTLARAARLGARLGEQSRRSPPRSRRCRARASSSTARRRRRTPRSSPPAPSFASSTASRCSAKFDGEFAARLADLRRHRHHPLRVVSAHISPPSFRGEGFSPRARNR